MTYSEAIEIVNDLKVSQELRDEANEIIDSYENNWYADHTQIGGEY